MSIVRRNFSGVEKRQIVLHSQEPDIRVEDVASQYNIHANGICKWRREYMKQGDQTHAGNENQ